MNKVVTFCVLLLTATVHASDKLVLIADGPLGIREGEVTLLLGMAAPDFEAAFGPPERISTTYRTWSYVSDGISVTFNEQNAVEKISVYNNDKNGVMPSDVATTSGIGPNASLRDIVRIHGKPTLLHRATDGSVDLVEYVAANGQSLRFHFAATLFALEVTAKSR